MPRKPHGYSDWIALALLAGWIGATVAVFSLSSQPPAISAVEVHSGIEKKSDSGAHNGDRQRPFAVSITPENQTEANSDATYQLAKASDEHAIELGIGAIVFGFLQSVALFITFWIMRKTARRQLRAYVDIESAEYGKNPDDETAPWNILLTVRNFGQTPAREVIITIDTAVGTQKNDRIVFQLSASADKQPPTRIPPSHWITVSAPPGIAPGLAGFDAATQANQCSYIWGRIEYLDVFGTKSWLTFQMVCSFHGVGSFVYCPAGNGDGTL